MHNDKSIRFLLTQLLLKRLNVGWNTKLTYDITFWWTDEAQTIRSKTFKAFTGQACPSPHDKNLISISTQRNRNSNNPWAGFVWDVRRVCLTFKIPKHFFSVSLWYTYISQWWRCDLSARADSHSKTFRENWSSPTLFSWGLPKMNWPFLFSHAL